MQSRGLVELLLSRSNLWLICYLSRRLLALFFLKEGVTQEMPCKLPKFLSTLWIFWVVQQRRFSVRTPPAVSFPLGLYFLGLVILCDESITSASETCFSLENSLLPWKVLFQCLFTSNTERFFYWVKCLFEFRYDIDWRVCFQQFEEQVKLFHRSGKKVSWVVHETVLAL